MTPELKAKWVEALRSGRYAQGNRRMRTRSVLGVRDTYCCLGVLCDVAGKRWDWVADFRYECEGTNSSLTGAMQYDLGIGEQEQDLLIGLNDAWSATFDDIADYIEGKVGYEDLRKRIDERAKEKKDRAAQQSADQPCLAKVG